MSGEADARRAATMCKVVGYGSAEAARVAATRKALEGRVGTLMLLVKQQLLSETAEEAWFDDDPDAAKAFSTELADYVMKVSVDDFGPEKCAFVAGLPSRLKVKPPLSAVVLAGSIVAQWLARELPSVMEDDPFELAPTLEAWQKLLAVHVDLMLSAFER